MLLFQGCVTLNPPSLYLVTGLRRLPPGSRVKLDEAQAIPMGMASEQLTLKQIKATWFFPNNKKSGHFGGGTGSSINLYVLLLFCLLVVFYGNPHNWYFCTYEPMSFQADKPSECRYIIYIYIMYMFAFFCLGYFYKHSNIHVFR